ncbi:MAG: hypothetical protein KDB27_19810 [Planctomycetales bacterium]|nr:hypothetical protein [Planctomycetales bacterium]
MEFKAGLALILLFLAGLTGCVLAIIGWILRPLLNTDGRYAGVDHYTLSDIACLTFLVAFSITLTRTIEVESGLRTAGLLLGVAASIVLWWGSVRVLSRCKVGRPLKRVLFMLVVAPISLFTAVIIIAAPFAGLLEYVQSSYSGDLLLRFKISLVVIGTWLGSAVICFLLNRLAAWIVRSDEYSKLVGQQTPIKFEALGLKRRSDASARDDD